MKAFHSLRALAAALALAAAVPTVQAGVFSATAFADIELVATLDPDVSIDWFNDLTFEDGFASDPAYAFYDNDALVDSFDMISSTLTSTGDALTPKGTTATAFAVLETEAGFDITNGSASEVELEFGLLYQLFASVSEQSFGTTAANAYARLELLILDVDTLLAEVVMAALDGNPSASAGDGVTPQSFFVTVPAGESRTVLMYLDAGGDTTHVPVPASLPLLGAGLALVGLVRRRRRAD